MHFRLSLVPLILWSCGGCMLFRPAAPPVLVVEHIVESHVSGPNFVPSEGAADIIRRIAKGKFPPPGLNPLSFSEEQFDPLVLDFIWGDVKGGILEQLKNPVERLRIESAELYIGSSEDGQRRIVFVCNPESRDLLRASLDLPAGCFTHRKAVYSINSKLGVNEISDTFHQAGKPQWTAIEIATSQHMNDPATSFRKSQFVAGKVTNDFGVKHGVVGVSQEVSVTNWFPTNKDNVLSRVKYQLRSSGETIEASVELQISTGSNVQALANWSSSEYVSKRYDERFRKILLGNTTTKLKAHVAEGSDETEYKGNIAEPIENSKLGTLQQILLEEYVTMLKRGI